NPRQRQRLAARTGKERPAGRSAPAPPPVMHELVDDLDELPDGATLLHDVARGRVERHHAVADPPSPLALRIEPDYTLHALADLPDGPSLRVVVVVARVAEDQDRRLAVERLDLRPAKTAERVAEVGSAVVVDGGRPERPLDGAVDGIRVEGLRDLRDLGHE